jgi:hypothetical protein
VAATLPGTAGVFEPTWNAVLNPITAPIPFTAASGAHYIKLAVAASILAGTPPPRTGQNPRSSPAEPGSQLGQGLRPAERLNLTRD